MPSNSDLEKFTMEMLSSIRIVLKELHSFYYPKKLTSLSQTQVYLFESLSSMLRGKILDPITGEQIRMKMRRAFPETIMTDLETLGEKIDLLITRPGEPLNKEEQEQRKEELLSTMIRKERESARQRTQDIQKGMTILSDEETGRRIAAEAILPIYSSRFLGSRELQDLISNTLKDIEIWLESKAYNESDDPVAKRVRWSLRVLRQSKDVKSYLAVMERSRMEKEGTDFEGQSLDQKKFKGLFIARITSEELRTLLGNEPQTVEPNRLGSTPLARKMDELRSLIVDDQSILPRDEFVFRTWKSGWGTSGKLDFKLLVAFNAQDEDDAAEKMTELKVRILQRFSQESVEVLEIDTKIKEVSRQELENAKRDDRYGYIC
jgi:hypothetical protein